MGIPNGCGKPKGSQDVALLHLAMTGSTPYPSPAMRRSGACCPKCQQSVSANPTALDPEPVSGGQIEFSGCRVPDAPIQLIKGDAAGQDPLTTPEWTEEMREAFADRIEGNSQEITSRASTSSNWQRRAYSPADLEAMNINLVGRRPLWWGLHARSVLSSGGPMPTSGQQHARRSARGCYHIGASTHPGPGLGGGSGFNVATQIIEARESRMKKAKDFLGIKS